jgi:hypothetical protein
MKNGYKKKADKSNGVKMKDLLAKFVETNGVCKICGHDHSYKPNFDNVKSSIDMILELIKRRKQGLY